MVLLVFDDDIVLSVLEEYGLFKGPVVGQDSLMNPKTCKPLVYLPFSR